MMGKPAIYIDRDGVVVELIDYLNQIDQVVLMPGIADAIRAVNQAKVLLVIITNQSGVARGLLTEATLGEIHARIKALLAEQGAHVDAIYYCPHHPDIGNPTYRRKCDCRKPAPGLLLRAADDMDIDLSRSVMIGDHLSDIEAGHRAGVARTFLVLTGHGAESQRHLSDVSQQPFAIYPNAPAAISAILKNPL